MKRIVIIIFFLFFLTSLSHAQPSIVFDSEKHNFGRVSDHKLSHIFSFTNDGDEELIIDKIVPS
ncbi:MAG: DUF1573 domain-containing protein [Nitrospirota bacterium]